MNFTKTDLINKIWNLCKTTHNENDLNDLKSFTIKQLKKILINLQNY